MKNVYCLSIKSTFVSEWDKETVKTSCMVSGRTGAITDIKQDAGKDRGSLIREYVILEDGGRLPVCPECHKWIVFSGQTCPNCDC